MRTKQYIIPVTESVDIYFGAAICAGSGGSKTFTVSESTDSNETVF
jgi:hypothetical protein